jgi:hypothetical protein
MLPGRQFRLYPPEDLIQLVQKIPVEKTAVWRPFLEMQTAVPVLIPVLPCPFPGVPVVLAINPADTSLPALPPSKLSAPVPLAAAARCIYDLLAAAERRSYPKIVRCLEKNAVWKQQGIYLFYLPVEKELNSFTAIEKEIPEAYIAIFRHFLENGFLLPPSPAEPAILPGELSSGEEAKLVRLLAAVSGIYNSDIHR